MTTTEVWWFILFLLAMFVFVGMVILYQRSQRTPEPEPSVDVDRDRLHVCRRCGMQRFYDASGDTRTYTSSDILRDVLTCRAYGHDWSEPLDPRSR